MNIYKCYICDYTTKDRSNLKKHLKTKRHLKLELILKQKKKTTDAEDSISNSTIFDKISTNLCSKDSYKTHIGLGNKSKIPAQIKIKKTYSCEYCNETFTRRNNLGRHLKYCIKKKKYDDENELKKELDNKNKEVEIKNKEIEYYKETVEHYKEEIEYYRNLVTTAGGIIKKSMNTLSYVVNNYNEAPKIKELEGSEMKLLENNKQKLIDWIIYNHNHKILHKYLGDFIIKVYKKEKPSEQSIWNTDSSRLTYIIKDLINNKSSKWKIDKKGIKTKKFLINPLLNHIKTMLDDNQKILLGMVEKSKGLDIQSILDKVKSIIDIKSSIEDNILCDDILRYITPHFYFDKNKIQKIEYLKTKYKK